jgi:hypothetical protein
MDLCCHITATPEDLPAFKDLELRYKDKGSITPFLSYLFGSVRDSTVTFVSLV